MLLVASKSIYTWSMRMVSEVVEIIEKKNNGFGSYAAGNLSLDCWMESDVHFNV